VREKLATRTAELARAKDSCARHQEALLALEDARNGDTAALARLRAELADVQRARGGAERERDTLRQHVGTLEASLATMGTEAESEAESLRGQLARARHDLVSARSDAEQQRSAGAARIQRIEADLEAAVADAEREREARAALSAKSARALTRLESLESRRVVLEEKERQHEKGSVVGGSVLIFFFCLFCIFSVEFPLTLFFFFFFFFFF
jgi:chromosome segregation ATPase